MQSSELKFQVVPATEESGNVRGTLLSVVNSYTALTSIIHVRMGMHQSFLRLIVTSVKDCLTQVNGKTLCSARSIMLLGKTLVEQTFLPFHWHLFSSLKSKREK